jgi:hypothetical protein
MDKPPPTAGAKHESTTNNMPGAGANNLEASITDKPPAEAKSTPTDTPPESTKPSATAKPVPIDMPPDSTTGNPHGAESTMDTTPGTVKHESITDMPPGTVAEREPTPGAGAKRESTDTPPSDEAKSTDVPPGDGAKCESTTDMPPGAGAETMDTPPRHGANTLDTPSRAGAKHESTTDTPPRTEVKCESTTDTPSEAAANHHEPKDMSSVIFKHGTANAPPGTGVRSDSTADNPLGAGKTPEANSEPTGTPSESGPKSEPMEPGRTDFPVKPGSLAKHEPTDTPAEPMKHEPTTSFAEGETTHSLLAPESVGMHEPSDLHAQAGDQGITDLHKEPGRKNEPSDSLVELGRQKATQLGSESNCHLNTPANNQAASPIGQTSVPSESAVGSNPQSNDESMKTANYDSAAQLNERKSETLLKGTSEESDSTDSTDEFFDALEEQAENGTSLGNDNDRQKTETNIELQSPEAKWKQTERQMEVRTATEKGVRKTETNSTEGQSFDSPVEPGSEEKHVTTDAPEPADVPVKPGSGEWCEPANSPAEPSAGTQCEPKDTPAESRKYEPTDFLVPKTQKTQVEALKTAKGKPKNDTAMLSTDKHPLGTVEGGSDNDSSSGSDGYGVGSGKGEAASVRGGSSGEAGRSGCTKHGVGGSGDAVVRGGNIEGTSVDRDDSENSKDGESTKNMSGNTSLPKRKSSEIEQDTKKSYVLKHSCPNHDLEGLRAAPEKSIMVTFHCIVPKSMWLWNRDSCIHIRFQGVSLGDWKQNCGVFTEKRSLGDGLCEMVCTLTIDAELLKDPLEYKYVVYSPKVTKIDECYEKLHPFSTWSDGDPNRCLRNSSQACYKGKYEQHDCFVYPQEMKNRGWFASFFGGAANVEKEHMMQQCLRFYLEPYMKSLQSLGHFKLDCVVQHIGNLVIQHTKPFKHDDRELIKKILMEMKKWLEAAVSKLHDLQPSLRQFVSAVTVACCVLKCNIPPGLSMRRFISPLLEMLRLQPGTSERISFLKEDIPCDFRCSEPSVRNCLSSFIADQPLLLPL